MSTSKPNGEMTPAERREFQQFLAQYVKGMKARGKAHAAQLALACEEELSRVYEANDDRWAEAVDEAEKAIEEAEAKVNAHIKEVFAERGLKNRRRMPSYQSMHGFVERGETWDKDRRAELRKVAQAQAKLLVEAAAAKAEEISTEFQERVFLGQMSREQALALARELPKVQELMPPLDPKEVHAIARQEHGRRGRGYGYTPWPELEIGEKAVDEEDDGDE